MIHDNIILSFCVDFESSTFTLATVYDTNELHEDTNIVFTGYFTHLFDNQQKNSIIFDIEEMPLATFAFEKKEMFKKTGTYGYPFVFKTSDIEKEIINYLTKYDYKAFYLDSSYGTYGWIIAKEMKIHINKRI